MDFLDRLPGDLEGKQFQVISPDGGYRSFIEGVQLGEASYFDILAVHEFNQILVRIYVNLDELATSRQLMHFSESTGEILTADAFNTGQFVSLHLVLRLTIEEDGATAGSLRMWPLEPPVP